MKSKKIIHFLIIGLLLLISIFSGSNQIASAKTSDNSVNLSGSLLNPDYLYISGQTMDNAKTKDFSFQTGDQPSYFTPYSYIGSNVYSSNYPTVYTPPNYKTENSADLNTLFGFTQSSIQPSAKAYFLKYGNIVPTADENDAINNINSPNHISFPNYNNYINNYPFSDTDYSGQTTTTQSSVTIQSVSIEKTIKLDDWFKFELNSTASFSAVLPASNGLYAFIAVQNFGSSHVYLQVPGQSSTYSRSLYGSTSSYAFFHTSNSTAVPVQISLKASMDSEVFIRVMKVDVNQQNLDYNSVVEKNQDIKQGDTVLSSDPFRMIKSIELHAYSFTVPTQMDGKLLSLKMIYRSQNSYSSNAFMYSELSGQTISTGSDFIGHSGEKIDVFFTTVNYDAYFYSLKIVQSATKIFNANDKLGLSLDENPVFNINIPSDGVYEFYFEHNNQNYDYFYMYNSTGYTVKSFYGSGSGLIHLTADTYKIDFYGSSLAEFMISPKTEANYGFQNTISHRSGALYKFDSINPGYYSFNLTTTAINTGSQVYVTIYSDNFQSTYSTNYYSVYTSVNINYNFYASKIGTVYFYITPYNINPSSNKTMLINLRFSGEMVSPTSSSQSVSASYTQPGTYNLTAGTASQSIQVNMNDLTPKTWNLLKIQTNNINLNSGFTLHISDNIIVSKTSLGSFPDYSVRLENYNPETIFGFGALSSSVQFSLTISLSNLYSAGSVQFIIQKMNTAELTVNTQQVGAVMPAANLDVNVNGFTPSGNAPGFEFYLALFAIALPVVIRKMRKKD